MAEVQQNAGSLSLPPVIRKEGWLYKRGEYFRNWRHRYFILRDNGQLLGFKAKPSTPHDLDDPVHTFTARGCEISISEHPKPFTFSLRGLHMTTIAERTFHAETDGERREWLEAIKNVKKKLEDECNCKEMMNQLARSLRTSLDAYEVLFSQIRRKVDKAGNKKTTFENFEFIKVLGRGTFGKVILCREKMTSNLYAIKILKKEGIIYADEVEHTLTENRVLQSTKHPFLIDLRCSFTTEYRLCFVMEYVNGGDLLFHWVKEGKFSEDRSRFYGAEIILAIGYLHKRGIIYRDLKMENLLLDKDGHIKIADFGLCKEDIKWGATTDSFCGTPEYIAPEVLECNDYGRAVDWWEFGVLMFQMMVGDFPFYHRDQDVLFDLILTKEVQVPKDLTSKAKSLLEGLLNKDPEKRLGGGREDAQEVMDHKFFGVLNWSKIEEKKVTPPFKPEVTSETDTRYFDTEFTGESVELTPPDSNMDEEGIHSCFLNFSYQDLNAELSGDIHLQTKCCSSESI